MASTTTQTELGDGAILKNLLIKMDGSGEIWLIPSAKIAHSAQVDDCRENNKTDLKEEVDRISHENIEIMGDVKQDREGLTNLTEDTVKFEIHIEKNYTIKSSRDHIEDIEALFGENILNFERIHFYQQILNGLLEKLDQKKLEQLQNQYLKHLHEVPVVETFECSKCDYETFNKQNLQAHLLLIHKSDLEFQVFTCSSCQFQTKSLASLRKHLCSHIETASEEGDAYSDPSTPGSSNDLRKQRVKKKIESLRKCDLCGFKTRNKESYKTHVITTHRTETGKHFKCHLCNFENRKKVRVKRHLLTDHRDTSLGIVNVRVYKCDSCDYSTSTKHCLRMHVLTHRNPDEIQWFSCSECEFKTKSEQNLKSHVLVVHKPEECAKKYLCEVCSRSFRSSTKLAFHSLVHKSINEVAEVFQCELCPYKTKNKYNLKQHMMVHKSVSEIKTFICDTCGNQFKRKWNYDLHLLTHKKENEVDLYCCDVCGYTTKFKDRLTRHLKKGTHSFRKRAAKSRAPNYKYNCSVCNFETLQRKLFHEHIQSHENPQEILKGCFVCEICDFRTRNKPGLSQHLMIHKPPGLVQTFKCPQAGCNHQTKFKGNLITHIKLTHEDPSQITIYKCDVCDFQSKRKWNYRTHMITHKSFNEVEVFKCSICSYQTKIKDYLRAHLKKRHNIVQSQIRVRVKT